MSNHLIIGLGGTGGKVIRNIRKAIYRDWRPSKVNMASHTGEARKIAPPGLNVEYLYVDTSKDLMKPNDNSWKVFGENLQLTPSSQLHLEGDDLKARVRNIEAYPNIASWIGASKRWDSIINQGGSGTELAAQQKRRLGRFLLAVNGSKFTDKIKQKIKQLHEGSMAASVQIHIVCGLAGGTGSGTIVDVVSMIRKEYKSDTDFPISLYLLLPEEHPYPEWAKPNYHANGYASLVELNSLHTGKYFPFNLTGNGSRYNDEDLPSPFNICFLVTDKNSNNKPFEVDKEIPSVMAEMIHHMLVAQSTGGTIAGGALNRVLNWENTPSTDAEELERSRRFASFGYRKISYPEEEIKEFIGYSLSAQTILQMLYNNWAQGYLDEEKGGLAVEGLVGDSVIQKKFCLDRDVFFLERQFSSENLEKDQKVWKPFEADWRAYIERLSSDIVSGEGNWLELLKRKCEEREKKSFRDGRGVIDYYSWKKDRLQEYSRLVTSGIEDDFSKALLSGDRSLTEIEAILRSLCGMLDKKLAEWGKQIEEDSSHAAKQRILWTDNLQRYEDLGPLARRMSGNKEKIFEAGKNAMITYFSLTSRSSAWDFASEFLKSVKAELLRIADHMTNVISAFRSAALFCAERAGEHRPEEKNLKSTEVVMRLFNGDEVTRYVDALIGNKEFQDKQARQAREKMVEVIMSGRNSLRNLPTVEKKAELLDILAQSSHETLVVFDAGADAAVNIKQDFGRLLSVSIIDKLRERYLDNPEKMASEIRDHMNKAGYLLNFNRAEVGNAGPGTQFSDENIDENWIVLMPDADNKEDPFVKSLINAFKESKSEAKRVQFVDTKDARRHEITILSFVQLFPLRCVDLVSKLKEKYELRIHKDPEQAILELHSEDPSDSFRPLFIPPVRQIVGPRVLLGLSLGSVRPKTSGGVAGTIKDELTTVGLNNQAEDDLGKGFDGAIIRCAAKAVHDRLKLENLKRIRSLEGNTSGLDEVREKIRAFAGEIAGDDDDAMKTMRICSEAALSELDGHLASIKSA